MEAPFSRPSWALGSAFRVAHLTDPPNIPSSPPLLRRMHEATGLVPGEAETQGLSSGPVEPDGLVGVSPSISSSVKWNSLGAATVRLRKMP